jgi:outer membrane lipoprotein-sorting protein
MKPSVLAIAAAACLAVASPALSQTAAATAPRESLPAARAKVEQLVSEVRTLSCTLEMSKKREKKRTRKTKVGPLQIVRNTGARLALKRKDETDEYIANPRIIWAYEHHEKEAVFIPTSMPIIGDFASQAMRLNVFMSADEETIKLRGSQDFEGEPCWVFEGKSPSKLRLVGLPITKIRVWISKRDGVARKISLPDEEDTLIILRDVEINVPLNSNRFEFTPPRGVKQKNVFGF